MVTVTTVIRIFISYIFMRLRGICPALVINAPTCDQVAPPSSSPHTTGPLASGRPALQQSTCMRPYYRASSMLQGGAIRATGPVAVCIHAGPSTTESPVSARYVARPIARIPPDHSA